MEPGTPAVPPSAVVVSGLVAHAAVVFVVAVVTPLLGPGTPAAVFAVVSTARLLLGMPWWLVVGFPVVPSGPVGEALVVTVPLLVNLAVHVAVLRAVRARRVAAVHGGTVPGHRRPRRPVFAAGVLLGAVTWGAWLGWDRTASYDVVTGTVQTPYVTLQVLGCALTVGAVTAVLAARWHPVPGAAGVGSGFWLVWTVDAASRDDSGLFAVGAVMLAVGPALGTTVAAAAGVGVRAATNAVRRRRGA